MKKYIFYFLIVLIGCSEDEELKPIDPTTKLLQKIEYSATDYTVLDYDTQNRMVRYFQSWNVVIGDPNEVGNIEHQITYGANGKAASDEVRVKDILIFTITYYYQGNQLHKTEVHSPQHKLLRKSDYHFSGGRLAMVIDSIAEDNQTYTMIKSSFAYYPNGNVKTTTEQTKTQTGDYALTYQIDYQGYDNQKNLKPFFWNDVYLPGINPQPNNLLKKMHGNPPNTSYTYSYEYDEEGYPMKVSELVNGKSITGQFKYQQK